ncbi:MAG: BMP family ABC transporter substrate-binding protein [Treponema sp.]|nr:BMP family ABC transporter substrate-binding protein [Treponema sp.]
MKKIMCLVMAVASVCLFGCSKKAESKESLRIAMVTDSGDITDQAFNQTTYQACKAYAEENHLDFKYYKPAGDSTADRIASVDAAYQDGYSVIVLPGFTFAEVIKSVASDYADAKFIGIDLGKGDFGDYVLPSNVYCASYAEELPGFFAGYAAIKEGYRHVGYLGGMAVPAVIRFGYGFIQGVNAAALNLGVADSVTIEYVYGGQFYGDQTITAAMDGWYKNRGVEVVFACGGGIWTSACEAAAKVNGKVIGVDIDQTALINGYGEGMHVTSALKGLGPTVKTVLSAIQAGEWDASYAGKIARLGLVSGTNLSVNYVGLPTDTWAMKNFTVDEYKALVNDVFTQKLTVSDVVTEMPITAVKINTYQNIK